MGVSLVHLATSALVETLEGVLQAGVLVQDGIKDPCYSIEFKRHVDFSQRQV